MELTRVGATRSERRRGLPGDDLVIPCALQATHAVTIAAPPAIVWPWLVQMGAGRAGWYSYDRLDNGGTPSATTIVPRLQHLAVGDVVPALPHATDAFVVADVAEARHLVLAVPTARGSARASWSFVLVGHERGTRLLTRARLGRLVVTLPLVGSVGLPAAVARAVGAPAHYLMQRRQLRGIRDRAEARAEPAAVADQGEVRAGRANVEPGGAPTAGVVPFPRSRRLIVDIGRATRMRPTINGFIEVDVTEVRRRLHEHEAATGQTLSLTAYIVACVGRTVAAQPQVHAVRDLRNRLVRHNDVDINVSIEVRLEGHSFPMNHVIRAADKRTVRDVSDELGRVKQHPDQSPTRRLAAMARVFLALPAVVRRWAFRLLYRLPAQQKALAGTVGLTAVGMLGRGGGWGTAFQVHPLEVVVGGIAVRPGYTDTVITPREYLHLTLSFDHDIVDGAPAARFASHLRDLIEAGELVTDPEVG